MGTTEGLKRHFGDFAVPDAHLKDHFRAKRAVSRCPAAHTIGVTGQSARVERTRKIIGYDSRIVHEAIPNQSGTG
jgi:hypothetical protein